MAAKQKILIVDDDVNIAELISLYLTKECFDTKTVNDGEEALSAFEHCAHHRRSRHQTAQPGGDDRRGLMNLLGRARNVRSVQSTAHHRSVPRNTAHEFSHS